MNQGWWRGGNDRGAIYCRSGEDEHSYFFEIELVFISQQQKSRMHAERGPSSCKFPHRLTLSRIIEQIILTLPSRTEKLTGKTGRSTACSADLERLATRIVEVTCYGVWIIMHFKATLLSKLLGSFSGLATQVRYCILY